MSTPAKPQGFVWYELMTTDAEAAQRFYAQVVGWQAADAGMPGMAYTLLSPPAGPATACGPVAGLMALGPEECAAGARPGWVGYVGVDDVDAQAAALAAAGGSVLRAPEDIPGVGRFAVVADPHGAVFCLFKGQPMPGEPEPVPPPAGLVGTVGWHELMAGELGAAWAFYSGLFGWAKDTAMDMGPMGTYQLFTTGGEAVGGMMTRPPEVPAPAWLYYFNVDAVDAAVARIAAAGGQVVNGPMEVPGGSWIVQAMDPQGGLFALVAPKR